MFEWARLKRMEVEALLEKNVKDAVIGMAEELLAVEEVFKNAGAESELERIGRVKEWVINEILQKTSAKAISVDYLEVFKQIGELVEKHLDRDDFGEKLLDVLISVTNSERGALFFTAGPDIRLVAGRNVRQETITNAMEMSRTVIKDASNNVEMVCCSDAINDRRFKKSRSIMLNKIRSIICAPLKIDEKVVGAVYLDSRFKNNLFSDEDKHFLLTVTRFIASLIERLSIYKKIEEENAILRSLTTDKTTPGCLVGKSSAICEVRDTIDRVAGTDSTVLITGETGSGKGLVARLIHDKSIRKHCKFVAFSCGAVPETLFESELFGHRKGAFTGAIDDKKGLFEDADQGTLFLDDISNAPLSVQPKLLQAIEWKTIRRLGEIVERKIDVRLISATNQDLKKMMRKEQFRDDLYYRIGVLTIHVPPLRERTMDIPLLADYFLKRFALKKKHEIQGFSGKAMEKMLSYDWPGNVRELQSAIESAVCLTREKLVSSDDIGLAGNVHTKKMLFDKETIKNIIKTANGNVSVAAKQLGVTRRTLYRYLRQYEIKPMKG